MNKNEKLKIIKYIKGNLEYLGRRRELKLQIHIIREEVFENLTRAGYIMKANENRVTE